MQRRTLPGELLLHVEMGNLNLEREEPWPEFSERRASWTEWPARPQFLSGAGHSTRWLEEGVGIADPDSESGWLTPCLPCLASPGWRVWGLSCGPSFCFWV